jgi:hypothetical protein
VRALTPLRSKIRRRNDIVIHDSGRLVASSVFDAALCSCSISHNPHADEHDPSACGGQLLIVSPRTMKTIYTIVIFFVVQCLMGCFPLSRSVIRVEKQNSENVETVKHNDIWYVPNTAFYPTEVVTGYVPISQDNAALRYNQMNDVVIERFMIEDVRTVKVVQHGYGWSYNPIRYLAVPVTAVADILTGILSLGFVNNYNYSRQISHEKWQTTISIERD